VTKKPARPATISGMPTEVTTEGVRAFKQIDTLYQRKGRLWEPVKRERIWTSGGSAAPRSVEERRAFGGSDRPTLLASDAVVDDSDKTFTVPAGEDWEILSIFVELVSTATAGNRIMQLIITHGAAATIALIRTAVTQAASLTRRYMYHRGLSRETAFVNDALILPMPDPLILPPASTVRLFDEAAIAAAADDMTVRITGVQRVR
jgi:hypothetical protein